MAAVMKVLCLVLCQLFAARVLADAPQTLKFVSVLYRHGDRSPVYIYPKDINQVANRWPDGLGWLSNTGKKQHYELGQYVRQRYTGFLNTTYYRNDEFSVESSGADRCLMSAASHLAGLYPPQEPQVWNPNLQWQPIPVHSRPQEEDNKLAQGAPCPRYDQLMQEVLNSPRVKKEEEENKEFYEMVERETGVVKGNLRDIWEVVDPLICEKAHNFSWNPWVQKPGVWEKLITLRVMSFDLLFARVDMAKLKGGPLLKEITSNMQKAVSENASSTKFRMYSAHDTTVASLLSAMRVFDAHQPMYRALLMVELHVIDSQPVVKILYKNTTDQEPFLLTPPGCGSPCKLETFVQLMQTTIPVDWNEECKVNNVSTGLSVSAASWIALTVGFSICLVICVSLIVAVMHLRKRRNEAVYVRL